jgi:hypothetical protein
MTEPIALFNANCPAFTPARYQEKLARRQQLLSAAGVYGDIQKYDLTAVVVRRQNPITIPGTYPPLCSCELAMPLSRCLMEARWLEIEGRDLLSPRHYTTF